MDTLAHAAIGMAVAGLSGHHPALGDPVYISTMLGAQAPDFDFIAQIQGDMAYLKQHRAFSHSIPGIIFSALAIALVQKLLLTQATFWQAFFWAFVGGFSHILLDYFNTHGVAILWPFRKDRKSYPLLKVFDPLVLLITLAPYLWHLPALETSLASLASLAIYILLRYYLRRLAIDQLKGQFSEQNIRRLWVMPALTRMLFWDFVIETDSRCINGQLGILSPILEIKADLPKQLYSSLTAKAQNTVLGQFFLLFTPFSYFEEQPGNQPHKVNIYDLRYFSGQQFIHRATVIFNQDNTPCETYIHSLGRTIKIQETSIT